MRANNIHTISGEYSGSGDDGGMDEVVAFESKTGLAPMTNRGPVPNEIEDEIEKIIWDLANPDFNNEGSDGTFTIHWSTLQRRFLLVQVNHRDVFIDYLHSGYEQEF